MNNLVSFTFNIISNYDNWHLIGQFILVLQQKNTTFTSSSIQSLQIHLKSTKSVGYFQPKMLFYIDFTSRFMFSYLFYVHGHNVPYQGRQRVNKYDVKSFYASSLNERLMTSRVSSQESLRSLTTFPTQIKSVIFLSSISTTLKNCTMTLLCTRLKRNHPVSRCADFIPLALAR